MSIRLKKSRAVTLIEVLIAITILAVVMIPVLNILRANRNFIAKEKNFHQAINLVDKRLSSIISLPYDKVSVTGAAAFLKSVVINRIKYNFQLETDELNTGFVTRTPDYGLSEIDLDIPVAKTVFLPYDASRDYVKFPNLYHKSGFKKINLIVKWKDKEITNERSFNAYSFTSRLSE